VFLFKTSQYLAARTAGASYRLSKKLTQVGRWLLPGVVWLSLAMSASAESLQTETVEPDASAVSDSDASREAWYYGKKGLTYDPEGSTNLWIGLRLQTRFDDYPGQNSSAADLLLERDSELDLNRGRLKGGGLLTADWLDVYFEYDQPSGYLLDLRATLQLGDQLFVRVGQWKSEYNRERIDSSGKQQMTERSISNYWFAIDRQAGVALNGRFAHGTRADSNWWLEYLSGEGRGGGWHSDSGLWLARYQWNPQGEPLPFSQSDLQRRERLLTSVAVAVVDGRTPYSRFSSDGGDQLPGITTEDNDLTQLLFETAAHWRGVSWQQELHNKRVRDRSTGQSRKMRGGYIQLGSFVNEWWQAWPRQLELAGRLSIVDPDRSLSGNTEKERTLGLNWFFNGHRNKLTLDYSWLNFEDFGDSATRNRLRLQWELSF
jgi:phosphate-selective porin